MLIARTILNTKCNRFRLYISSRKYGILFFYMLRRLTLSQIQFFVFDRFMKLSTVLDGFSASPTSRNVYSNEVIPMRHPTVGSIDLAARGKSRRDHFFID